MKFLSCLFNLLDKTCFILLATLHVCSSDCCSQSCRYQLWGDPVNTTLWWVNASSLFFCTPAVLCAGFRKHYAPKYFAIFKMWKAYAWLSCGVVFLLYSLKLIHAVVLEPHFTQRMALVCVLGLSFYIFKYIHDG